MVRFNYKTIKLIAPPFISILILLIVLGSAIIAILFEAKDLPFYEILKDAYIQNVLIFTIWQATISTLLTVFFAIPIARALHRRREFFGRNFLIKITTLSFILPTVVLVLGIAVVHGRNGWISNCFSFFGFNSGSYLYGLFGILIGHLTFSLPLAIRVFLNRLDSIPTDNWRLAGQIGFSSKDILKLIEMPILLPSISRVMMLIFMMCFTSFAIVLSLGGGPVSTTIEVAIYQALKFDFDIGRAVSLSLIQLLVCTVLIMIISKLPYQTLFTQNSDKKFVRPDLDNLIGKISDGFFILCMIFFIVLPLLSVIISGMNDRFIYLIYSREFWLSFGYSIYISTLSGILSLLLASGILSGSFYAKYHLNNQELGSKLTIIANISMIMPPFILATGIFIVLRSFVDVFNIAVNLVIIINAIMALPFVVGILYQAVTSFSKQEIWLCQSLDLKGWNFFRIICWGRIRKAVGYALALSVAMSWGDLSIVALFGSKEFITLPYLLYHNMSNYKVNDAATIAFIILLLSYILIWIIEEFVGGEGDNVRT